MTDEEYMSKINSYLSGKNNYTKSTSKATSTQKLTDEEYMNKVNSYLNNKQRVETTAPMQTSTSAPSITPKETIADKMNQLWVEDTPQNNNISYKPASVKDFVNSIKDEVPQPAQKTPVLPSNNTYKPVNVKDFVDSINNKAVVEAGYDPNSFSLKEKALLNSGNYSVNPNYDPKNKYSKKVIYTGNVLTNKDVDPTLGQKLSNAAERTGRTAMDLVGNVATGITQAGEGLVDAGVANAGDFLSNLTSVGGLLPNKVSEGIRQGSENFVKYGLASDMKKMIDEDSKKGSGIYKPSILGIDVRDIAQEGARMITLSPLGMAGFMASAAGSSTEEALNEGEKLRNAVTYGNIAGAIEGATEKMFDTFGIIGGGKFDKFLPKSVMGRFIAGGIGEGIEEGVSGAINPFVKMLTYEGKVENPFGSKENFNNYLGDLGQQMLAGMVTGWVMQGTSDISSSDIRNQFRSEVSKAVNKLPVESNVKSNIADKILGGANRLTNAQIDNGIKAYKSYINEYMTKNIKSTIQSQNVQGLIKNSLREKLQNVQNNTAKDLIPGIIKAPQNANMNVGTQNTIKQRITNTINNNTQLTTDEKQGLLQILEENSNNLTPDAVNFFNDTINNLQNNRLEQVTNTEDKKVTYKKYLNDKTELDKTALETAKNSVPANKSGRRTKEQWLKVANTIGQQIYDLSDAEIERYAYKSWQETHPNQAGNLNRQGKGFVKFTSDEWIDAVTRSAQQAKAQTKSNNKLSTQKKTVINSENIFKQITNNTNAKVYNDLLIDNKLGSISKEKLSDITKRYNTFSEKHNSDFNENNKHKNSNVNSEYYYIDNNWIKLTTTQEGNNLFIDELYVENPGQGIGSKIVELLKDYADKKGLQLDTAKELKSAEGFWNKTLRGKAKQELSTESEQVSKLPMQKDIENKQTMKYNEDIENTFANVKVGEVLNVPTKSLLPLLNGGGYRTEEQVSELRNKILKDGIPGNIKVYRNVDGQIELEDGNHRIQIANELGIKNLPVEMISRWSDVLPENNNLDIQNEIKEVIYNDRASNPNSNTNEESRSKSRSLPEGYVVAKDRGTTDENAKISGRKSYDNESRSNVENERNNRQIEDSNKSSFSMSETKDNKGRTLSKEQEEYFKDSKVRDEDGNLIVMYHGTENGNFDSFEYGMQKGAGKELGDGFYFTKSKSQAEKYAGTKESIDKTRELLGLPPKKTNPRVYEVYLNVTHPLNLLNYKGELSNKVDYILQKYTDIDPESKQYQKAREQVKTKLSNTFSVMDFIKEISSQNNKLTSELLKDLGYDGLIDGYQTVVFEPSQIKIIEGSNKSSFSMPENSLDYQGKNLGSGKAEGKNITADKASGKINDFLSKYTAVYDKNMKEALDQLIQVKNKPNAEIKIYRASPSDSINSGDWVYLSKAQAEKWTKTHFGTTKPGYKVTEKTVKASDVDWTGKNLDFVYKPENIATSQNKLETQADKSSKLDYISPVENIDKASDFVNNATEKDIETLEKMVKEAEKYPYRIDLQFFAEKAREKLRYLTKSQKYRNSKINAIANEIAIDYNMDKRDITAALSEYAKDYANNGKSIKDIDKFAKRIGITNNNYLEDKLNNLRNSLDLAERYDTERLNDKAKQEMEKQEYKLNTDTVSKLYELKQQYQKDYEKVDNKLMLTKLDRVQLDRLIKGEITEAELPENSNKSEILEAYKSKKRLQDVTDEIKRYNKAVKHKRMSDMRELVANSSKWKDKKTGLQYGRETQERNIMDIAPESDAKAIIKKVFDPIHHNEAEATKYKNSLRNEVRKLDLNSKKEYEVTYKDDQGTKTEKVSERGLVQLYGEKKITDSILDEIKAPKDKIKQSVETFRNIYNGLYEKINKVRVENGYAPIDFRKDYFPHFEETKADGMIGKALQKLGLLVDTSELPTDIAGLTHMRRPGTKWVSNFLKRTSDITVYDAIEGFDSYLDNVADVIYHTDDIQKLRAYENAIRYQHSDENVKKQIDDILDMEIADEEKASLIDQTYSNAENNLSHYVQDIRAYTDTLAGKKSLSDREIERDLGRGIYNITKAVQGKVSANMVGANLSSALTNIIPLTQATSVIKMPNLLSAIYDTAKSTIKSDGFAEKSDFIVNRRGSERLNKTVTDKMADATNVMGLIDDVVSETVTRGKYYQNIKEGMEESEAIDNANKFAAGLLADRSKGSMPTMFNKNNPMMKLLTAFQLEVNNQWSYMFKDIPREYKDKFVGKIVWGFAKMFIGAYIYNEIYEKWTGRRSALDPIDWVKDVYTGISKGDSSFNIGTKLVSNVSEQVPFISGLINGGRLPISNALPSVSNTYKAVTELADTSKRGRAAKTLAKEFSKPLFYIVPPFGGGQIKKTAEGLITYVKGGEYGVDSDGNKILKFPVERTPGNLLKSLLFGKYSTEGAKRYVDSNFKTLSVSQTKGYEAAKKAGVKPDDFYKVYEAQKGIEGVKDKNGKTIPLSASQNKKKAIDELIPGYTKKQKEILYEAFGISKQVWKDAYKK